MILFGLIIGELGLFRTIAAINGREFGSFERVEFWV
jgi:hypothetical protein